MAYGGKTWYLSRSSWPFGGFLAWSLPDDFPWSRDRWNELLESDGTIWSRGWSSGTGRHPLRWQLETMVWDAQGAERFIATLAFWLEYWGVPL